MSISNKIGASSAIVASVVAIVLLTAAPIFAHARYKSSTPGTGEVLATSPPGVDIYFTQQIQKVSGTYDIAVTRDRGAAVTGGPVVVDDGDRTHMSVPLQADLGPGRYVVNWKNTSDEDGDSATGAFSFYVGTQPNAVDLANDAQLAIIGFEDATATAAAESSTTPGTTASDATPAPSTPGTGTPAVQASPGVSAATPSSATPVASTEGGDSNTAIYVIIAAIALAAIGGSAAFYVLSRRRQ